MRLVDAKPIRMLCERSEPVSRRKEPSKNQVPRDGNVNVGAVARNQFWSVLTEAALTSVSNRRMYSSLPPPPLAVDAMVSVSAPPSLFSVRVMLSPATSLSPRCPLSPSLELILTRPLSRITILSPPIAMGTTFYSRSRFTIRETLPASSSSSTTSAVAFL